MEELIAERAILRSKMRELVASEPKTNTDEIALDTQIQRTAADMRKLNSAIAGFAAETEKDSRVVALANINDSLAGLDWQEIRIEVRGVVKRGESGKFDDLEIGIHAVGTELEDVFHSLFNEDEITALTSVKSVKFAIDSDGITTAEYSGAGRPRGTSTGSSGGGHGWVKDGNITTLNDAFREHATPEEIEAHDSSDNGNQKYAIKTKIAKAAGYEPNKTD